MKELLLHEGSSWESIFTVATSRGSRYGLRSVYDGSWRWAQPDEVVVLDKSSWFGVDERWHEAGESFDQAFEALLEAGEDEEALRECLLATFPDLVPRIEL